MSLRASALVWELLVVFLAFIPTGRAASAECVSGWEWSDNSRKQNPCEVAGYLQGACLGYDSYELEPLAPDTWYTEPEKGYARGLMCGCNTIIYSLYSACMACQGVSTPRWPEWNHNCDTVYVTRYPFDIPGVTAVPRWAFLNVTVTGNFSETAAKSVGRDPEALGKVPLTLALSSTSPLPAGDSSLLTSPTSGTSRSTPGTSSSASDPLSTGDLDGATSGRNNTPVIIGGVIGGVAGLTALSLLVWLSLRHRSREGALGATRRAFSHRTFSTRQSYYPPSASVYSPGTDMNESGNQTPAIYSRLNPASPRESMYGHSDPHPITGSTESDSFYGGGRGHTEF